MTKQIDVQGLVADHLAAELIARYGRRSAELAASGYASCRDIDTAMRLGCGLPNGPFEIDGLAVPPSAAPANPEPPEGLRPIRSVGVVGSGTMAQGIADAVASSGLPVVLAARGAAKADAALVSVAKSQDRAVAKGKISASERDAALGLLTGTGDVAELGDCDLVVEAVAEDLAVKQELFARLDSIAKPEAVLATTTSSLTIADCARATARPHGVLGLHFFNPAKVMKLVEVVYLEATPDDVLISVDALLRKAGKTGVYCGDRPGFIVNYLLIPYLNHAAALLGQISPEAVDRAVEERYGFPLGPFRLLDVIGLDIALAIQQNLHRAFGAEDLAPAPALLGHLEEGRLGRKTNHGFYRY